MENCLHPVQMHGLCAICGLDLTEENEYSFGNNLTVDSQTEVLSSTESPTLHILHTTPHIKVTPQEAARIGNENMHRLLKERKLSLVVDLDQTVLHATVDANVHEWLHDPKHPNHIYTQDIHKVALHDSPHIYYVKLRPGLEHFFVQLSKLFELHVYTMGSRSYAHAVVKLFDPDGRLFQDRILSRDDSEIMENRKKLTRIFPTDDRMVVVIDDRSDVWPDCPNLVQVPAYSFFLGTGDINNPFKNQQQNHQHQQSASLHQQVDCQFEEEAGVQHHTESTVLNPNDNELVTIEQVLTKIHSMFYGQLSREEAEEEDPSVASLPDVKTILTKMKQDIFTGISMVFSGILSKNTSYEEQMIWRVSREFGAVCEEEITDRTTHLITSRNDTEKVLEAVAVGNIKIINSDWIFNSIRRWKRENEENYRIEIIQTQNVESYNNVKRSKKRKLLLLEEEVEEEDGFDEEVTGEFETLLDANDFNEINKELEDLESSESESDDEKEFEENENDCTCFDNNNNNEISICNYCDNLNLQKSSSSDVNISSEEFSDLLDSIEEEEYDESENNSDNDNDS